MKLKRHLPIIITGVIFVLVLSVSFVIRDNHSKSLGAQLMEKSALENKIETVKAGLAKDNDEAVSNVSGLNAKRVSQDDEVAKAFMNELFNWRSYEQYTSIRSSMMDDYHLSEDSSFLTVFMPELEDRTDAAGNHYNVIDDAGYNVEFSDMTSYVTGISGSKYSYFTMVDLVSSDSTGNEGSGKAVFVYTVDSDGNLSDLNAYTIS